MTRKPRPLKSFVGNLDGQREGLVFATSKTAAARAAGLSLRHFNDYWAEGNVYLDYLNQPPTSFEPGTLYTRPFNNSERSFVKGQRPLRPGPVKEAAISARVLLGKAVESITDALVILKNFLPAEHEALRRVSLAHDQARVAERWCEVVRDGVKPPVKKHPMQPVVLDDHGVARFKANAIVRYLSDLCQLEACAA